MSPARVVLLVALVVYAACLPFDAFCVDGKCSDWPGWSILAFGWVYTGSTDANTVWLANPLLLLAWILVLLNKRMAAILFSLGALGLAFTFLAHESVITNEAGLAGAITGVKGGYWLWIASMVVTLVAALLIRPPQADER
jgi:hypothetical protein